jgi:long-chain acyl-CoA synthetase
VLHFSDDELPRTATRKVKRREVVVQMEALENRLRNAVSAAVEGKSQESGAKDTRWLLDVVASVANRPRASVSFDSRFSDLGFDSLMYVELATAIENAGGTPAFAGHSHGSANLARTRHRRVASIIHAHA